MISVPLKLITRFLFLRCGRSVWKVSINMRYTLLGQLHVIFKNKSSTSLQIFIFHIFKNLSVLGYYFSRLSDIAQLIVVQVSMRKNRQVYYGWLQLIRLNVTTIKTELEVFRGTHSYFSHIRVQSNFWCGQPYNFTTTWLDNVSILYFFKMELFNCIKFRDSFPRSVLHSAVQND